MHDNGLVPPMSPEDFAALAAFAGPIYQESRLIEKFTSDNPIPGGYIDAGSMSIKQGLEQAQRLAQASVVRPPQPMYVPPAVPLEQPDMVTGTASFTPYPEARTPVGNFPTPVEGDQLEFSFSSSKQDVTNDLLKEISKKLTKVISLLEGREDKVPKSKQNVKPT